MLRIVVAVSLMVLATSYACAGQSGDYVGVSSGVLLTKSSTLGDRDGASAKLTYSSLGIPVSISLGHQFGSGLRVEEELAYKRADIDAFNYAGVAHHIDGSVWCLSAMSNLYYDWYHNIGAMAESWFSPYVVAGVGVADVGMSEGNVDGLKLWNSDSSMVFAYQLGIGSGIRIRDNLLLDISYRYFDAQRAHIDQVTTSFQNGSVLLGVRYTFR